MVPLNLGFLQQTMTVMQRRTAPGAESGILSEDEKKIRSKNSFPNRFLYGILVFFAIFGIILNASSPTLGDGSTSISRDALVLKIATNAELVINFEKAGSDQSDVVSLGPHRVSLVVKADCKDPSVWIRLEGDSLVGVNLQEDSNGHAWSGMFSLPIEGSYDVVAYWHGCNGRGTDDVTIVKLHSFSAKGAQTDTTLESPSLYPNSAWIATPKFHSTEPVSQSYIWLDPKVDPRSASLNKISSSVFAMEGTLGEQKTYSFGSLSNYEIVCWIGSDSAQKIYSSFMEIRPLIASWQRPFKFHFHPSDSFTNPDREWSPSDKSRFRKCKHVLVSFDEMKEPLSQDDYRRQVKEFIFHLTKAFPDETFPIWMFTVMESPTKPKNCHTRTLPKTSDHPCNDVLKNLFQTGTFPERVYLLDNTDLSLPQENIDDITAVVALRIFVLVGKRVKEWREANQIGTIKGLVRGEVTEPNFELVPYTGWELPVTRRTGETEDEQKT